MVKILKLYQRTRCCCIIDSDSIRIKTLQKKNIDRQTPGKKGNNSDTYRLLDVEDPPPEENQI